MPEIVDARDVLDANARIKSELSAEVLGFFERIGPNAWDDYQFVPKDQGLLVVHPGIDIQLEIQGTDFRMRKEGRVIRVRWAPGAGDPEDLLERTTTEQRGYFTRTYLVSYADAPGAGAASWIANKLGD